MRQLNDFNIFRRHWGGHDLELESGVNGRHTEGEILVRHEPEPGRSDHVLEDILLGEAPDAFN